MRWGWEMGCSGVRAPSWEASLAARVDPSPPDISGPVPRRGRPPAIPPGIMPGYGVSPGNAREFCREAGNRMSRRIVNITLDKLGALPPKCRRCVFWELGPVSRARAEESGDPELEKESGVSSVLLGWGSCGKIAYVDGVPAGYMMFAPPQYVPRSIAFPTSPVSADAVLLMTAHLLSEFAGGGIGRMLVQAMAKDLTRRGVEAIEAFGDRRWDSPSCMLPVDYLLAVGFKTIRPHHHYPRLRMELRTLLTWREDVEVALERLLGSMTPSPPQGALRPV